MVTDGQGFTSTVEQSLTATNLPTASFTYAPNPGIRKRRSSSRIIG